MTIMPESSIYKNLAYLERSGELYSRKFMLFKKNAIMNPFQLFTNFYQQFRGCRIHYPNHRRRVPCPSIVNVNIVGSPPKAGCLQYFRSPRIYRPYIHARALRATHTQLQTNTPKRRYPARRSRGVLHSLAARCQVFISFQVRSPPPPPPLQMLHQQFIAERHFIFCFIVLRAIHYRMAFQKLVVSF